MTRKTKKGYYAVFSELASHLGVYFSLDDCIMDFEIATVRAVFPGVNIHGCSFHYTQEIYREVCELK